MGASAPPPVLKSEAGPGPGSTASRPDSRTDWQIRLALQQSSTQESSGVTDHTWLRNVGPYFAREGYYKEQMAQLDGVKIRPV